MLIQRHSSTKRVSSSANLKQSKSQASDTRLPKKCNASANRIQIEGRLKAKRMPTERNIYQAIDRNISSTVHLEVVVHALFRDWRSSSQLPDLELPVHTATESQARRLCSNCLPDIVLPHPLLLPLSPAGLRWEIFKQGGRTPPCQSNRTLAGEFRAEGSNTARSR